jgi:membrane protease YdiL (CAAX protease family)
VRARRYGPRDPADIARSAVPLALIVFAAALPIARPFVLAGLIFGVAVAIRRDAPVRWAWAAPIPVAVSLCWGLLPVPAVSPSGADCASITSPTAVWRTAEAGVVIGTLAILAWALRTRPVDLRVDLLLRMPALWVVRWSIIGFLVAGPLALVLGPTLARPFFGQISYDVTIVGALAPALLFAVANGSMEELAYRGALLGWSARVIGIPAAVVGQAVVFGLAHSGADVSGSPLLLMAALGLGGLIAGVIAVRTRSLLLPMAVHIGLDIPIYYAFACGTL